MRFFDANIDGDVADASDNTLYYLTDANHNVTAVFSADTHAVVERYVYDPYGKVTIYADTRGVTPLSASAVENEVGFGGYLYDAETALSYARNRYYDSSLGRWVTRDPLGYEDGPNLYQYTESRPLSALDPSGLTWLDDAVWNGIIKHGNQYGIPTHIPTMLKLLNMSNIWQTHFVEVSSGNGYKYNEFTNNITLEHGDIDMLKGMGPTYAAMPFQVGPLLSSVYNEMFHAFYDQVIEQSDCCAWVRRWIDNEAKNRYSEPAFQFQYTEMVEEAMSEMLDGMVTQIVSRPSGPTLRLREHGFGAPLHNAPGRGETWSEENFDSDRRPFFKRLTDQPVSPQIRDLTLWILQNGCKDPASDDVGRVQALRDNWNNFVRKYGGE